MNKTLQLIFWKLQMSRKRINKQSHNAVSTKELNMAANLKLDLNQKSATTVVNCHPLKFCVLKLLIQVTK
jgi:hypothetical protein